MLTTAVEVLKEVSEKDTTADLLKFFQEENRLAREHEMTFQMLFLAIRYLKGKYRVTSI